MMQFVTLNIRSFLGCYIVGNIVCFRSGVEVPKNPGSVADSSGYHILQKPGSNLGPWNCNR